jgi:hypothetical protein
VENPNVVRFPVVQIRPYGVLAYDRIEFLTPRRHQPGRSPLKNLKGKEAYAGLLSPGARKRLRRAIQIICAIAEPKKAMNFKLNKEFKFKLNFITLTLPCPQGSRSDKEIKSKVLDVWLKAAKRKFKLRSYIWRAERQGNGNLHFHIVTDTYVPYDELRDTWNDRLNALGFIDEFEKRHGHRHPNSTDVHAIKKVKNLAAYFSKYMAKGEKVYEDLFAQPPRKGKGVPALKITNKIKFKRILTRSEARIDGRLWDCSTNLKQKGNCETLIEGEAEKMLESAFADPEVRQVRTDQCLILFFSPKQFAWYIRGDLLKKYQEWLSGFKKEDSYNKSETEVQISLNSQTNISP